MQMNLQICHMGLCLAHCITVEVFEFDFILFLLAVSGKILDILCPIFSALFSVLLLANPIQYSMGSRSNSAGYYTSTSGFHPFQAYCRQCIFVFRLQRRSVLFYTDSSQAVIQVSLEGHWKHWDGTQGFQIRTDCSSAPLTFYQYDMPLLLRFLLLSLEEGLTGTAHMQTICSTIELQPFLERL